MAVGTKTTRTQTESDIQGFAAGSLADGAIIGPYEIIRFLGRGGMGEVYEVRHNLLDRRFALKLISQELSRDEKARELFRREGREAGNLDHPNIVRVDDCGEVDGRMYLRMELIEGRPCRDDVCITLTDLIIACQRRVPPGEAIPILHDILKGLTYAHLRRRVHRDIKPSNILMTPTAAKIGDFGLVMAGARPGGDMSQMSEVVVMGLGAQLMMNATQAKGAASAAGTPDYMAPELLSGSVEANYSTDVYSVGILLLEMLTGSRRVGAAKPSQLLRSFYKLEPWWDQLYERSTAYHEDRFANASEMLGFFVQVSGFGQAKALQTESPSSLTTTQIPANWGNGKAPTPASPPSTAPAPKPGVAPVAKVGPPPSKALPEPEARRVTPPREPPQPKRRVPFLPIGAGGVVAVLGAFLYLATRPSAQNPKGNHFQPPKAPVAEPNPTSAQVGTKGEPAKVVPEKTGASPGKSRQVQEVAGGDAAPNRALTNTSTPKLVAKEQQLAGRVQQAEVAVERALREGRLDDAWKLVSQPDSPVGRPLKDGVLGAHQAAEKVSKELQSENMNQIREALQVWQKAKPPEAAEPETIRRAREYVAKFTAAGEQQQVWREQVRTAIQDENVPVIRRLLEAKKDDQKYETDRARIDGEKALQKTTTTLSNLMAQARASLEKGDLTAARSARESLNQYLTRTHQPLDSTLQDEILSTQRSLVEQKVKSAVEELGRYQAGESQPPVSSDPEINGRPLYQQALASAMNRHIAYKKASTPEPTPASPSPARAAEPVPAPSVAARVPLPAPETTVPQARPPASSPAPAPQTVPDTLQEVPKESTTGSKAASTTPADRATFETLKGRLKQIGNATIPSKTKQDMLNWLDSYRQGHPDDAKEASRLIENLRNR